MKLHIVLLAAPAFASTFDSADSADSAAPATPLDHPGAGPHGYHGFGGPKTPPSKARDGYYGGANVPSPTHKGKAAGVVNPFAWGPAGAAAAAAASILGGGSNEAGNWPGGWPTSWPEGKGDGEPKKGGKGKKSPGAGKGWQQKGGVAAPTAAPSWTTAGPLETFLTATLMTATIRDGTSVLVTSTTIVESYVGKAGPGLCLFWCR
jgi:hypothetical protein